MKKIPLGSLIYFDAVARHLKFNAAAEELNVTQGAVSQQVKTLEEWLGCNLFIRSPRELKLSRSGELLLPWVQTAIQQLEDGISLVSRRDRRNRLRVAALPTLSTRWLIPRLERFHSSNADILVEIVTLPSDFVRDGYAPDLDGPAADVGITYGAGGWPGFGEKRIFDEEVILVCSPEFEQTHGLSDNTAIKDCTLLQHTTRPNAWRDWSKSHGPEPLDPVEGPRFEHLFMVREAAISGFGLALLPTFAVASDLETGRLTQPIKGSLKSGLGYYIVWPEAQGEDRAVRKFVDWISHEAAEIVAAQVQVSDE